MNNGTKENLIKSIISDMKQDIELLKNTSFGRRNAFVRQLSEKILLLEDTINEVKEQNTIPEPTPEQPEDTTEEKKEREIPDRIFTSKELEQYNSKNGMPTYISYQGVVYDVSDFPKWKDGMHFGMPAGRDLTIEYTACHAGRPKIDLLPIVGKLKLQ